MISKSFFINILIIGFSSCLIAQEPDIEQLLEQQKEYSDISDLLEMLAELEQNPLDLNRASAEQLSVLPWISNVLANAIVNYRNQIGRFKSIDQLTQVENVSPELVLILGKYITVTREKSSKAVSFTTKSRYSQKLESSKSYRDRTGYSSPAKIYNRFKLSYGNNLRLGLLLEKDSGERQLDDLSVYYLSYGNSSNGNKILIGNYRLEFAQGLIFGNPYSYYKGYDPIFTARRQGRELLKYTIVDENASLHGIAYQRCFKIYQFFVFISSKQLDATINDDGTVKNFYTSGYHRSETEIAKKDRLNERLVGGRFLIKPSSNFFIGTSYYQSLFNRFAAIQDENLYRFAFSGKKNELIGFDYNLTLAQFNLFGEIARSQNSGFGLLTGLLLDANKLELVILGRNYSKDFISFYGNSFGERSDSPQNEQGIYFGLQLKPIKKLKLGFYFDQFKYPWRSYFMPMPSSGKDLMLNIECKAFKKAGISLIYKFEQKEKNISELKHIVPRNQNNLRLQLDFQPLPPVKLRCRIEKKWITYQYGRHLQSGYHNRSEGILLYQDLLLKLSQNFDLATRLTFFDTDDFESRLYQFEPDVPGMLTNQMLYDNGTRSFIRMQWKIKKVIRLSIKYGSTQYFYPDQNGFNSEMKSTKIDNAITCQLETNW